MAAQPRVEDEELRMALEGSSETPIDDQIRDLVETHAAAVESRIEELENEVAELENFTKITLRDRRIGENTANIGKVSDSFSGFAENTSNKLNSLENRIEVNAMVLAAIAEALDDSDDVDIDLADVRRFREDNVVTVSADERLSKVLDGSS